MCSMCLILCFLCVKKPVFFLAQSGAIKRVKQQIVSLASQNHLNDNRHHKHFHS